VAERERGPASAEPTVGDPGTDDQGEVGQETHRGAFGEFAGESSGLIDRTFRERIVLVGVSGPTSGADDVDASLDELAQLVDTAGADAVARVVQRRHAPDPATYIGRGKAEEVRLVSESVDGDTVVFDDELSPAQQLNLQRLLGRSALDRTAVILDIFAQNAHSPEGKAQVELAQLRYNLPRLRGRGAALSQQAGGIGTRGPGETQLEIDRRRIVRRIHRLESQLADVRRHRAVQRKSRIRSRFARVALVGYTNAGKSTLLNRLTDAGVLVEDRLFATLDPTTRRHALPGGETVLVSDTVGFVKKLPHQLVEAFKTTLDVVTEADLLVQVVDASAVDPESQMAAVRTVLEEIGAAHVPELAVFNKADQVADATDLAGLLARHEGSVAISALTGEGVDKLLDLLGRRLRWMSAPVELRIPFERGDALATAHREGEVLVEAADEHGYRLRARLDEAGRARLQEFVVEGTNAAGVSIARDPRPPVSDRSHGVGGGANDAVEAGADAAAHDDRRGAGREGRRSRPSGDD
jgi:GTP-binding protein HflX